MNASAPKKILIGLTGQIGSGKSTALACFEKLGAGVLSADDIVRKLYQKPSVRKQIVTWFGSSEPAVVAARVFADPVARKQLEDFLHPLVWREMQAQIKRANKKCWVLELPLLFEAGWEHRVDVTVLLCAGTQNKAARLKARGLTVAQYKARLKNQLPQAEQIKRADICISNDKTPRELEQKIAHLYEALKQIYHF